MDFVKEKVEFDQLEWTKGERILFYGIGNKGRQDDGLGVRLIEKLEGHLMPPWVSLEANYQLNIEDALLISSYDVVVFIDASKQTCAAPFSICRLKPAAEIAFSSHAIRAEGIVALCEELYHEKPRAFHLLFPGYQWEISEELSDMARLHLADGYSSCLEFIQRISAYA